MNCMELSPRIALMTDTPTFLSYTAPDGAGLVLMKPGIKREAEGHATGVAGVAIAGGAVVVHTTEAVGVAGTRRTLPPEVRRTIDLLNGAVASGVILVLLIPHQRKNIE